MERNSVINIFLISFSVDRWADVQTTHFSAKEMPFGLYIVPDSIKVKVRQTPFFASKAELASSSN
jgi:hypothetical protein